MHSLAPKQISRFKTGVTWGHVLPQRLHGNFIAILHASRRKTRLLIQCSVSKNAQDQEATLQNLLGWLGANGTKDISKASLFLSTDGERGVLAAKNIAKGEIIFQVPIKLAVIDDEEDEMVDSNVPWSARLASKILSLKAQGADCPWSAYIESLPKCMSNPTSPEFAYSDVQAVGYPDAREEIDFSTWVASSSYNTLCDRGMLPKGTSFEEFCLALSIVHSRTFSIASREKRDGVVRMLMPLVDMLNHSGDVDINMSNSKAREVNVIATDACRWDCVPKIGGGSILCVSAVRDVVRGEEITLSYGERSNDDFFVHYGFVPPRNPHDSVSLFNSPVDAILWTLEGLNLSIRQNLSHEFLAETYEKIMGEMDAIELLTKKPTENLEFIDSKRIKDEKSRIKLQSKGRVDERLAILLELVFSHISGLTDETLDEFIRNQVANRSFELLLEMKKLHNVDFLSDLDFLVGTETGVDEHDVLSHQFSLMRLTYGQAIKASPWWEKICNFEDRKQDPSSKGSHIPDQMEVLSSQFAGYNIIGEIDTIALEDTLEDPSRNPLPIMFRAYKQLILWDSLLLS